jgi:hypothetical protein
MALQRTRRLTGLPLWRRLCVSLLLPLMLLLTQQAGWLHALSHEAGASTQQEHSDPQHAAGGVCDICLGFAQLGSGALPPQPVPQVIAGAAFHWAAPSPAHALATPAPPQRSRGPPSVA